MSHSIKYILIVALGLIIGCTSSAIKTEESATFSERNQPQDMYLDKHVKSSIDSMYVYYEHAINALEFGDSIGSRIYYDKIFSYISELDEESKSVLLEWEEYNDLIKKINNDYETIFAQDVFDQEAEEIREELTDFEEEVFGDSTGIDITDFESEPDTNLIPLQMNRRVELALKYFQTKGRKVFTIWLERSGKYEAMIKSILNEYDLPENLVYLSMIESGFNPKAFSYARASGLWQFIYGTGSYYGLRSDWWFDERRDPLLASHAAAQHLRDLNERFGDWYLALAGYNCNPKRVERTMRRYNTRDFWKLKRLPRQTRNYIPTFIAANIIAQNPEKYGFYIEKMQPVAWDTVQISECVDLEIVAQCVDATFSEIKELNPAVKRWCTPPGVKKFTLNIPVGSKEKFRTNYASIPDAKKRSWVRHKVRSGETLSVIAKKYGSTVSVVKSYNKVKGSMIYVGQYLLIPVPQNKNYYSYQVRYAHKSKPRTTSGKKSKTKVIPKNHKKITYIVKQGDTLGEVAEVYNTRASKIRSWNGLYYGQHIYPKQKLTLWVPEDYSPGTVSRSFAKKEVNLPAGSYHVVKYGDTLWDISQKYGVSIENLKKLNNKRSNTIKPGEKIIIKPATSGA
jgi:membrane-bound lytic murein transglycosylase D